MTSLIDNNRSPAGLKQDRKKKKVEKNEPDEKLRQAWFSEWMQFRVSAKRTLPLRVYLAVLQQIGEEVEGILKNEEAV